jgi:predicted GIY-YIG superfamily endonuclease
MLHCRDRTLYVGHTDDLDVRLAQHEQGTLGGYTARKRPVKLVWCQEFPTRYEALAAERQIKGWRKEKKLALIRGDWDLISGLSRDQKERPSTSSGRTEGEGQPTSKTVRPEPVEGRHYLLRHPSTPAELLQNIAVTTARSVTGVRLRFECVGAMAELSIPAKGPQERADNLWQHTCFEAFLRFPDGGYREYNFSPSTQWAAYRFSGYRAGLQPLDVATPKIIVRRGKTRLQVEAQIEIGAEAPLQLNLTAVIEEKSGRKSYWALAQPPEGPPDFHHPACFVLELPAPGEP